MVLSGNLNKKDIRDLFKKSDSFVKEILEVWSGTVFEEKLTSEKHFIASPLWCRD